MKLFSFGKEKKQEGFVFQIDDVFALKGDGVVVTGRVTEGVIRQGGTGGLRTGSRHFLSMCN